MKNEIFWLGFLSSSAIWAFSFYWARKKEGSTKTRPNVSDPIITRLD